MYVSLLITFPSKILFEILDFENIAKINTVANGFLTEHAILSSSREEPNRFCLVYFQNWAMNKHYFISFYFIIIF